MKFMFLMTVDKLLMSAVHNNTTTLYKKGKNGV